MTRLDRWHGAPAPQPGIYQPAWGIRINRRVLLVGLGLVLPVLGVLAANMGRDPHTVRSPLVGRPAPLFTLQPVGGGSAVSLAALRGQPVVINFWATWCVPCYQEHEVLVRAARQLGSRVHFLGVVYEDEEARISDFLARQGQAYPTLMDVEGRTAIAYGVYGVPETFFVSADGVVAAKYQGPLSEDTLADNLRRAAGAAAGVTQ